MSSITSWSRLEPRPRSEEMRTGLQARVHDPLWLLARQWQLGEFQGEDAGSPAVAHLQAECSSLTRFYPGRWSSSVAAQGQGYDISQLSLPLETLIEREPIRGTKNWWLAAEAGLHFLRLLAAHGVGKYRSAYVAQYPLAPTEEERQTFDRDSLSFLEVMAPRTLDGARLYQDLLRALRPPAGKPSVFPPRPAIDEADRERAQRVGETWLDWYEQLFSEPVPGGDWPWIPERMEYQFAVSGPTAAGEEVVLTASEYTGGHLDWYSFNVGAMPSQKTAGGPTITYTVIPAPVTYRGMPAPRFWEFEDRQIDFGAIDAGPEDLARMLLMEFALVCGNDWYVIPVQVTVGAVCRIRSLGVSDTFGQRTLIQPFSQVDPGSPWRMFQLSPESRAAQTTPTDIFFLPPVLGPSLESNPVEEVLFLRDEMANIAWAVERVVESPIGRPLNRYEAYQEEQRRQEREREALAPTARQDALVTYRLASEVPPHWIPLIPKAKDGQIRLKLVAMPRPDGSEEPIKPQGRLLKPDGLELYEDEISRAGVRVSRAYQYARWIDGSTLLWIGRRKRPGRGEGSSGLRYDILVSE